MQLRDYQEETIRKVIESPSRRICIVAPTGAGKTVIGAEIAKRTNGPVLWISHTEELDRQADLILPDNTTTVTVQTLLARSQYPDVAAVIVDECHHYVAESWGSVLEAYKEAKIYGLTATPQRGDGVALGNVFDQMIVATTYSRLLADGHLVPCDVYSGSGRSFDPVVAYKKYTNGETAFVYVSQVNEAEKLAHEFNMQDISADFIGGNTTKADRPNIISRFGSGELKVLVNVYTLTEGVDIPRASACIIARNISHVGTYLQIAGRILRPHPGKKKATIIDLPGVFRSFGPPTMDREYTLSGKGISGKKISVTTCKKCGRAYQTGPKTCPGCGEPLVFIPKGLKLLWSEDLKKVYDCENTPTAAKYAEFLNFNKIRKEQGRGIKWLIDSYKLTFNEDPPLFILPEEDKREDYNKLVTIAKVKGFKSGWASYIYKSRYGKWPGR